MLWLSRHTSQTHSHTTKKPEKERRERERDKTDRGTDRKTEGMDVVGTGGVSASWSLRAAFFISAFLLSV